MRACRKKRQSMRQPGSWLPSPWVLIMRMRTRMRMRWKTT